MSALLWWCDSTYTICRVTLPTERVSWNFRLPSKYHLEFVTLPTERVSWNWLFQFRYRNIFCHAPHGACELKSSSKIAPRPVISSRSPRSVWVEISTVVNRPHGTKSRSPRSVWVEIFILTVWFCRCWCHAPHGACELKCLTFGSGALSPHVTLPTERVSWNSDTFRC